VAEFVIVGGGVYGAAVAYWLADQGGDVHLLEARNIGNGASAGPGRRGTRANGRDIRELPLMRLSHQMWPHLHEVLGHDMSFFERSGGLRLIEREHDLEPAKARAMMQNRFGAETHLIDGGAVRELEPSLSKKIIAALHCPNDGASDHTAVTNAFADAARRAGAVISEDTRAASIEFSGGLAEAVITDGGERIAVGERLFILANAGVEALVGERVALPLWSRTFQVMVTSPVAGPKLGHLIGHASRTLALKAEDGGRIMISGGLPGFWDARAERGTALPASMSANLADAAAVMPALDGIDIELADADHLESSTIDGIPVIDTLPGAENTLYAAGWCGHGWAIAPALSQMMADWGRSGELDPHLKPFAQARFAP